MHRDVTFTVTVYNGGDISGAHIHVNRKSSFAEQNLAFDVGEVIHEDENSKIYNLIVTDTETTCPR